MSKTAHHNIRVVPYEPQYAEAFYHINKIWIDRYFMMEPKDHDALEHPEENIISPGGTILVALANSIPVGVCALLPSNRKGCKFELAKMGVSEHFQGLGIGRLLCEKALETARKLGAAKVYLESNTMLTPALTLYRSLGFREVDGGKSPYSRSNIQMEVLL
ncbi:MAG: hypothetical protein RLZZ241_1195 [Bacteroidota bacterium]|jgi:GNAT superfamily N-acetyltransferase